MLVGDEEFILSNALYRLANTSECEESPLLIAVTGNSNEVSIAAIEPRPRISPSAIGATSFRPPHGVS